MWLSLCIHASVLNVLSLHVNVSSGLTVLSRIGKNIFPVNSFPHSLYPHSSFAFAFGGWFPVFVKWVSKDANVSLLDLFPVFQHHTEAKVPGTLFQSPHCLCVWCTQGKASTYIFYSIWAPGCQLQILIGWMCCVLSLTKPGVFF